MIIANIPNALHITFMRTKHPLEIRMMFVHVPVNMFKPSNGFLLSKMVLLFFVFFAVVIFVLCLSLLCCLVCSLQTCYHMLVNAGFHAC